MVSHLTVPALPRRPLGVSYLVSFVLHLTLLGLVRCELQLPTPRTTTPLELTLLTPPTPQIPAEVIDDRLAGHVPEPIDDAIQVAQNNGAPPASSKQDATPPTTPNEILPRTSRPDRLVPKPDVAKPDVPKPDESEPDEPQPISQHFVHTEPELATNEAPENTRHISAHDTEAAEDQRTRIISIEQGPLTPPDRGTSQASGVPLLHSQPGEVLPNPQRDEAQTPLAAKHTTPSGGGGHQGQRPGHGAPGPGREHAAGGQRAAAGGATRPALMGGVQGAPIAPKGHSAPGSTRPSHLPTHVLTDMGANAAASAAAARATQGTGDARSEQPDQADELGGTELPAELPEDTPAKLANAQAPADEAMEATPVLAEHVDPVRDLQEAMGWAPVDRSRLGQPSVQSGRQGRQGRQGRLGRLGRSPTSPQTVLDQDHTDATVQVSARGTPLGRYIQEVDDLIAKAWNEHDLSLADKALGIQGRVTIRLHLLRSGKVRDLHVARSSGHLALDTLALNAVPHRLPRFSNDITDDAVTHELTLIYRNPFISR